MSTPGDLWTKWETMLGEQDYAGLASLFAPDAVYVEPVGRHEGRDGIAAWLDIWSGAFSDVGFETSRVVEQGAVIVAEWTWRNTNTGPLTMPDGSVITATGKTHESDGVTILELKDGQIVAARDYYDPPIEVTYSKKRSPRAVVGGSPCTPPPRPPALTCRPWSYAASARWVTTVCSSPGRGAPGRDGPTTDETCGTLTASSSAGPRTRTATAGTATFDSLRHVFATWALRRSPAWACLGSEARDVLWAHKPDIWDLLVNQRELR